MTKLKTSEATTLTFSFNIEGSNPDVKPIVNYVIESNPFSYSFEANYDDGVIEVEIPALKEKITAGDYKTRIEVLLEDSYFKPWTGNVLIESPVEIKVESQNSEDSKTISEKIDIKVDTIKEKKTLINKSVKESKIPKKVIKKHEKKPVNELLEELDD